MKKEKESHSTSAIVHENAKRRRVQRVSSSADKSISEYYQNLSDIEAQENEAWANIAESQFALIITKTKL
jgi:hypothetical protein